MGYKANIELTVDSPIVPDQAVFSDRINTLVANMFEEIWGEGLAEDQIQLEFTIEET